MFSFIQSLPPPPPLSLSLSLELISLPNSLSDLLSFTVWECLNTELHVYGGDYLFMFVQMNLRKVSVWYLLFAKVTHEFI